MVKVRARKSFLHDTHITVGDIIETSAPLAREMSDRGLVEILREELPPPEDPALPPKPKIEIKEGEPPRLSSRKKTAK